MCACCLPGCPPTISLPKVPDNTPDFAEPKRAKTKKDKRKQSQKGRDAKKSRKTSHVSGDVPPEPEPPASPMVMYKTYDISMIPEDARPDPSRQNKGRHSYTLGNSLGDATIEVLLKQCAFFVKKVSERGSGSTGHISMRIHGVDGAWQLAKERSGFDS